MGIKSKYPLASEYVDGERSVALPGELGYERYSFG